PVLAQTTARAGGGAGGVVAVAVAEVLGQLRPHLKGVGVQTRRGGEELLEDTQAAKLDVFAGAGWFHRALQDRGDAGVQLREVLALLLRLRRRLPAGVVHG